MEEVEGGSMVDEDVGLSVAAAVWLTSICGSTLVLMVVDVSASVSAPAAADADELSSRLSLMLEEQRRGQAVFYFAAAWAWPICCPHLGQHEEVVRVRWCVGRV